MPKVLVIDDDDQVRPLVRRMLERDGHEVAEAANGAIGLKLLEREEFDLIVTDILMPGRDGVEVLIECRRARRNTPILAMSGGSTSPGLKAVQLLDWAAELGAVAILCKPFDAAQLIEAVNKALEQSRPPR